MVSGSAAGPSPAVVSVSLLLAEPPGSKGRRRGQRILQVYSCWTLSERLQHAEIKDLSALKLRSKSDFKFVRVSACSTGQDI